jgi:hypothetical protein
LLAGPVAASDLVVVMDDLGYSLDRAERVLAMPAPVTLALLPFAPATAHIAARALETGHEVILHQPMEALVLSRAGLALGTLTTDMSPESFDAQLESALGAVPGIIGVNNHTGSRLTQDIPSMQRLMHYLAARDLMFLDSRTTAATVAYTMAREAEIPALERDVFLDHVPRLSAIEVEFQRALAIARSQGHAVIIAHPHDVSLAFLARILRRLPEGFSMISLKDLADRHRPAALVRHESPASPHRSLGQ